jgi:predicted DNA-binding protein (MmcQ/YjbR family)
MTRDEFNTFCGSLPATTHVVQWGGSDVWKIGERVFAICGSRETSPPGITFKTSDIGFEMLQDSPGYRPAPYLASRGMKWIQRHEAGQSDAELQEHLRASYRIVAKGLSRKRRRELGIEE